MKYKTEFTHTLVSKFDYACGGDKVQAVFITVPAPTNLQRDALAALEQEQAAALMNAAAKFADMKKDENKTTTKSAEPSNEDAEQHVMLMAGNGMDLARCYNYLKTLISGGVNAAKVDAKEPMTPTLFDGMSMIDTRIMLGKYLLNFLDFSQQS